MDHLRGAPAFVIFRHTDQHPFSLDAHVVAGKRVEGRRLYHVAVDDVENSVMPGTHNSRTAKHAFSEWSTVVRTHSADSMETTVNARQQDSRLADRKLFHLSVSQVGGVCEVNFFETHSP